MAEETRKPGEEATDQNPGAQNESGTMPGAQEVQQQTDLPLDQIDEANFSRPEVRRLLNYAKAFGRFGSGGDGKNSVADFSASELAEKMIDNAGGYRRFDGIAEILFNAILQGKMKEEEVTYRIDKLVDNYKYWLFFHTKAAFGANATSAQKQAEAVKVIELLIDQRVFGDDLMTCITRISEASAMSAESRDTVNEALRVHAQKSEELQRKLADEEAKSREAFELWKQGMNPAAQPGQAKEETTSDVQGGTVEEKLEPPQNDNQEVVSAPEEKERFTVIQAHVRFDVWKSGEDRASAKEIKMIRNGQKVDPVVSMRRPIRLIDKTGPEAAENGLVEIDGDKIVIVSNGRTPIVDVASGIVIHRLELEENEPTQIMIGGEVIELTAYGVHREKRTTIPFMPPMVQANSGAAAGEQTTAGEQTAGGDDEMPVIPPPDDVPVIESKEDTEIYKLPAVLTYDANGNITDAYACLDDTDRIVTIGSDETSDIRLPSVQGFKPYAAEVKFIAGKIFVNAGKDALAKLKDRIGSVSGTPVLLGDDVLEVGDNGHKMYFGATMEHPFSEPEILQNFYDRFRVLTDKITALGDTSDDIKRAEKLLADFKATVERYRGKMDISTVDDGVQNAEYIITQMKGIIEQKEAHEREQKLAKKRHFVAESGETADTPRPFKYAVLVDKKNKDTAGNYVLYPVFPPGRSMGTDKVNTLELAPARTSKYGVQEFECTVVLDESGSLRLPLEVRTLKNSKILVNGQIPGTRDGKTKELDMLRPSLHDGDELQIGPYYYGIEMGHEFSVMALKPYVKKYVEEIMEVLVLYPDHGDQGDRKNAEETLKHFLAKGLTTDEEIAKYRAVYTSEKNALETTAKVATLMNEIRGENQALLDFVENDGSGTVGLPYDSDKIRAATLLADDPSVRWENTGWTRDQFVKELKQCARARLFAYDKKLLDVRTRLANPRLGARIMATFSADSEREYQDERNSLQRSAEQIIREIASIMHLGIAGKEYEKSWLNSRTSAEQYNMAVDIMEVQAAILEIVRGVHVAPEKITQLMAAMNGKVYAQYYNSREVDGVTLMTDFIYKKVREAASALLEKAKSGENISGNLAKIEGYIHEGILSYENIGATAQLFDDLREDEKYFERLKLGEKQLNELLGQAGMDLETVVDFGRRITKDEIALSDENEAKFRAFAREQFAHGLREARVSGITGYFSMMMAGAVRQKLLKPKEIGATSEELAAMQEQRETTESSPEVTGVLEEIRASNIHNIHPLLKLKKLLDQQAEGGKDSSVERLLVKVMEERIKAVVAEGIDENNLSLYLMVFEDMRTYGLEDAMREAIRGMMDEVFNGLYYEEKTVEEVRPLITTLRLLDLDVLMIDVLVDVRDPYITRSFENPDGAAMTHFEKFQAKILELGLN